MLKLLHCAQNDPGALSKGAEGAFIWKGGALSSTKASFTGLAPSSYPLLKTVPQDHFIPCLSLCQQHFLVYTST